MTPSEAIQWLHSLPRLGGGATLRRMQVLLRELGSPERQLKCVQIAGTNGKGTVAALTAAILQKAGYKTGLTISPFVLEFRERFQINGGMIPPGTLAALAGEVRAAAGRMAAAGGETPVEFEAVTALALLWFAREGCDVAVLETGLGGRYDATNAVQNTLVSAITRIGLDHTELLGDTLDAIAREKCGIIKPGCIVVSYPSQPKEALREIVVEAGRQGCELVVPDLDDLTRRHGPPFTNRMDYGGYEVSLPFIGAHQACNAAVAVEIALALCRRGLTIEDEAILAGLEAARLPARIELLRREPLVLLDGCHNPDGAAALAGVLREEKAAGLTAIIGMLADKKVEDALKNLSGCFARVYTVTPNCPRAMPAEQLAALAGEHFAFVQPCQSLPQALTAALAEERDLVVCGSLYLAAEARGLLLKQLGRKG